MEPLNSDPYLGDLVEKHGVLELEESQEPFKRLVTSIVNQQLSTESAAAIRQRLFENFEITPEGILEADHENLKEIGLSRQKIEYLESISRHFIKDELTVEKFESMSDQEVIDELTDMHGVGVWTAKMFLIFVLAREDVFPVEDLGIRRAMEQLYGDISRQQMVEEAEKWSPYRSIASLYLWKLVD